jgi:hypothetical protein
VGAAKDSAVVAIAVAAVVDEALIAVEAGFAAVVEGLLLLDLVLSPNQSQPPSLQHGACLQLRKSPTRNPKRLRQV